MPKVVRRDRGEIRNDYAVGTKEGYIEGEAVVTRTGVFTYKNMDGTVHRELRHPDEVFKKASLDTLKMIPITMKHPSRLVDAESAKSVSIGTTGEIVYPDGDLILASFRITDSASIKMIEDGERELSLGYESDLLNEPGQYNGIDYDFKQTNIIYNHLAVVEKARAGAEARIALDKDDCFEVESEKKEKKIINDGVSKMPTFKVDGIDYETTPQVINFIDKLQAKFDQVSEDAKGLKVVKLDSGEFRGDPELIGAHEKLQGEYDAQKLKLDEAAKVDHSKAIAEGSRARSAIILKAQSVMDAEGLKKLDSMSDEDIMKEIIVSAAKEDVREGLRTALDSKSSEYLKARYDAAIESIPDRDPLKIAEQRGHGLPDGTGNHNDAEPDADAARGKMIEHNQNLYKGDSEGGVK